MEDCWYRVEWRSFLVFRNTLYRLVLKCLCRPGVCVWGCVFLSEKVEVKDEQGCLSDVPGSPGLVSCLWLCPAHCAPVQAGFAKYEFPTYLGICLSKLLMMVMT